METAIIIGSKVMACNIGKLNASREQLPDFSHFYEEGTVVNVEEEMAIADVEFKDGSRLINGRISAFKPINNT